MQYHLLGVFFFFSFFFFFFCSLVIVIFTATLAFLHYLLSWHWSTLAALARCVTSRANRSLLCAPTLFACIDLNNVSEH